MYFIKMEVAVGLILTVETWSLFPVSGYEYIQVVRNGIEPHCGHAAIKLAKLQVFSAVFQGICNTATKHL